MSTIEDPHAGADERSADRARDAFASDIAGLTERARAAGETAESIVARGGSAAPLLAAGAGVVAVAMIGMAGGAVLKIAGRAAAGMLAGVASGFAMNQVHRAWGFVEKRIEGDRIEADRIESERGGTSESAGGEPATVKLAEAVVGPIADDQKARAGAIAHYAMSGVAGAVYELLAPAVPLVGVGHGLAYGATVWAVVDEVAVPALDFAAPAWRYPIATHVRALLAHLVYGATLDFSLRLMRRALT